MALEESRLARILRAVVPDADWRADLEALASAGVHDESDLLFPKKPLDSIGIPLDRLEELREIVLSFSASPGQTAERAYDHQSVLRADVASSGVPGLDVLLGGGWQGSEVVEVAGTKGVGKTLILMRSVIGHLHRDKQARAHWIDTTGDFAVDRALQVLEVISGSRKPEDLSSQQRAQVFDRLTVSRCFDVRSASETIAAIAASAPLPRFIVVDSMVSLFGDLLNEKSAQGAASMVAFVRRLSALAKSSTTPLTILLANNASPSPPTSTYSAFASTTQKPALGVFAQLCETTVWLSLGRDLFGSQGGGTDADGRLVVIEVLRARRLRSGVWCSVRMVSLQLNLGRRVLMHLGIAQNGPRITPV